METSILKSVKKTLGLAPDYTPFDEDIIMHINSVFADLNQLGLGPEVGFEIQDDTATWDEYLQNELRYASVKSYMNVCLRLLFDPPDNGYTTVSMEKMKDRMEWRMNIAREEIEHPPVTT